MYTYHTTYFIFQNGKISSRLPLIFEEKTTIFNSQKRINNLDGENRLSHTTITYSLMRNNRDSDRFDQVIEKYIATIIDWNPINTQFIFPLITSPIRTIKTS